MTEPLPGALPRPRRRDLWALALVVGTEFSTDVFGVRFARQAGWLGLPARLGIVMMDRVHLVHIERRAVATIRPPGGRSWTAATFAETFAWILVLAMVVSPVLTAAPMLGWAIVILAGLSMALPILWLLWPNRQHLRSAPRNLSRAERREYRALRRNCVEISSAASTSGMSNDGGPLLFALRRHLATAYPTTPLFVAARTQRHVRVYSLLGLEVLWRAYGAMSTSPSLRSPSAGLAAGRR